MYVFSYHESSRVFTVGESDHTDISEKKEVPYYGSAKGTWKIYLEVAKAI